jgi:hypothetical protein
MADPLKGLDASVKLTRAAECLKRNGFDFAIRYYNIRNQSKNLTLSEAQALVRAGLQLGAVWEDGSPIRASFFNKAKGVRHGKAAFLRANDKIGQPAGTPIYFAVDFDALASDVDSVIKDYFEGVHEGLRDAGGGNPKYEVGVYGSGLTCRKLLAAGLVTFTWLAGSTGFQGSKAFAREKRFNLIQFLPRDVCRINVDPDETNPDKPSGLFTIPLP